MRLPLVFRHDNTARALRLGRAWFPSHGPVFHCTGKTMDKTRLFPKFIFDRYGGNARGDQNCPKDQELIDWGKPLLGDFATQSFDKIVDYNRAEIVILARMMEALREGLKEIGISPHRSHGPGVLALEVLKQQGIVPDLDYDQYGDRKTAWLCH
jgi:hypothetical protein